MAALDDVAVPLTNPAVGLEAIDALVKGKWQGIRNSLFDASRRLLRGIGAGQRGTKRQGRFPLYHLKVDADVRALNGSNISRPDTANLILPSGGHVVRGLANVTRLP